MRNVADDVERVDIEHGEVGIYTPEEITGFLAAATPPVSLLSVSCCRLERSG